MRFLAALIAALVLPFAAPAQDCAGRLFDGPGFVGAPLCLPADPQRIVVLDRAFSLGMALDLGLPVVAAPLTGMSDQALKARAEALGVADTGRMLEPSLEAMAAARPDLILGGGLAEAHLPMLRQIAPVALIATPDWRGHFRAIGRIAGRAGAADDLLAPLDARIAALRPRIPDTAVPVLRITS